MRKQLIYCFIVIPFLGLIVTNTVVAQDPTLVGWWKLDEGNGSTIIDSSIYGNDSNLTGTPMTWVDGRINNALQFDGIGSYVELIDGPSLDITDVITITMWVNTNGATNGVPDALLMKGEFTYGMRIDDANNLEFYIYSGGYHRADIPLSDSFDGVWHHLVGIYDGDVLSLYIDGELQATVEHSGAINENDDYFVNFGRNSQGGSDNRWWYDGAMDDIRIYNRVLSLEEIQRMLVPELSSMPIPADGAGGLREDVILEWTPGISAQSHDVYLGTVFDEVNQAGRNNPMNVLISRNQNDITYDPAGSLEFDQTYYWRVDEVEADGTKIHTGQVWSFTVPFGFPIEQVKATASSSEEGKEPENTVNGSGLDSSGLLHVKRGKENMWLSTRDGQQPTMIEFEFDKVYKLHEMWVWNSNESLEPTLGLGFKEVTIEYSLDGTEYMILGATHEFAKAPGKDNYAHNTTIDFNGEAAKFIKLTVHSNWGGILNQYGLSEVRFLHVPVHATEPTPDPGTAEVALDAILSWKTGREAIEHIVYLSDDVQAVTDGTADVVTVTDTSYGPLSLDLGKTYYWRIDEVNNAEALNIWQGNIWSFTTHEYFIVDDFEDYNDYEPDRVFDSWIDGWGIETNGSTIGYAEPDFTLGEHFVETTTVHEGLQAMPFFYENNFKYSEAILTLNSQRDWTEKGVSTLALWFRGNPIGFMEEPAGIYTTTALGTDIWGTADEFRYVFKQLSGPGSIVARMESMENTDPWAKAGVMIRQTLDPDSKFAAVYITPENGCRFQARTTTATEATSDTEVATEEQIAITAPYWIKIERDTADNFNGYYSNDGINWQAMTWNPQNISMSPDVYIGLAVTSHNVDVTCSAMFSGIQTTGEVTPLAWTHQAIGVEMPSNDAAPMYLVLDGSAVVYHDNPNASLIAEWTEWNIDLQEFAAQGIDLNNISTVGIGFGNRDNPQQPGGSGLVFIDDIRLYPSRELEPAP